MFDGYKAGKYIALLRKNKGMTQEELAQMLQVSPQAVSKWENGHAMPEVSVLVELSKILRVTIDEILFPTGDTPTNANFEHILLPYEDIADFSGRKWPRSQAWPAILSAIKLLMGLECQKDAGNRQLNDDTDYILQSALVIPGVEEWLRIIVWQYMDWPAMFMIVTAVMAKHLYIWQWKIY